MKLDEFSSQSRVRRVFHIVKQCSFDCMTRQTWENLKDATKLFVHNAYDILATVSFMGKKLCVSETYQNASQLLNITSKFIAVLQDNFFVTKI